MAYILAIESATKNCSVALFENGKCLFHKEEVGENFIHSEMLHLFIAEVLKSSSFDISHLNAIAIGAGPGSYTGLRIGLSAAKGLAFALNIPLISANSLEILMAQLISSTSIEREAIIHPMIDARRMEVYTAAYSSKGEIIEPVSAKIIEEDIYQDQQQIRYLIGDGAAKYQSVFKSPNYRFPEIVYPSALSLGKIAHQKFQKSDFEDLAYFEPFYVKNFQAVKAKSGLEKIT